MMVSPSAVILSDSADDLLYLKNRLPHSLSVLFASNCEKALKLIECEHPDYFIATTDVAPLHNYLLNKLRAISPSTMCVFFTKGADSLPEAFFSAPSANESAVLDRESSNKRIDEAISKLFLSLGIPPHFKGYHYLRTGVELTLEHPDLITSVTTTLYPMIAERYGTTGAKVERSIRHALTVAWNKGRTKLFNSLIGIDTLTENARPTSSEFIALVADRLLLSEVLYTD